MTCLTLVLALAAAGLVGRVAVTRPQAVAVDPAGPEGLREVAALPGVAVQLRNRLRAAPDDGQGWALLARTHLKLGQVPQALDAFGRSVRLLPQDADLHVEYADALAASRGSKFDDESSTLIRKALAAEPKHLGALSLAGLEAYDRGDYNAALAHWERFVALAPSKHPQIAQVRAGMASAKARRLASQAT